MQRDQHLHVLEQYGYVVIDEYSVKTRRRAEETGGEMTPILVRLHSITGKSVCSAIGNSKIDATYRLYDSTYRMLFSYVKHLEENNR